MSAWWVRFQGRDPGCVEAETATEADAIARAITSAVPLTVRPLPYPANPRLNKKNYPPHGPMPSFCYRPDHCAGRTSCPESRSCVD